MRPAFAFIALLLLALSHVPSPSVAESVSGNSADRAEVRRAAQDYLDAIYDVKPELIERSVHPSLTKLGFWRKINEGPYREMKMTYDQLFKLAGQYNKKSAIAADAPRLVEVLSVLETTAAARVTAEWGYDYMQLAKFEGRWKIVHILWESRDHAAARPQITPELLVEGKALFAKGMCNKCHGDAGKGTERAPDLTDAAWLHSKGGLEGIRQTIVKGVSKEAMKQQRPYAMNPIGSRLRLDDSELYALAAYVKSLSK